MAGLGYAGSGSRHDFYVATRAANGGIVTRKLQGRRNWCRDMARLGYAGSGSRHDFYVTIGATVGGVATWPWCRDTKAEREDKLVSRQRKAEVVSQHCFDVATLFGESGVTTWFWCLDLSWPKWCHDKLLVSRHDTSCLMAVWCRYQGFGSRQRQVTWACRDQRAHPVRARPSDCARNREAVPAAARRARAIGFWVCALFTRPSFEIVHCLRSLFLDIVHKVSKKKEYKKKNKFFVYV